MSAYNYLVFHAIVELLSISIGLSIFFLTFHARRHIENNALLLLGLSFLALSALEMLHILSYEGMGVFPTYDGNLPIQLWIVYRTMFVLTVLAAPFMLGRRLAPGLVIAGYCLATALAISIIFLGYFPDCYIVGLGLTPFKVWMELGAFFVLGFSGVFLLQRSKQFDPVVLRLLLWAIAFSMATGLVFIMYSALRSPLNALGHILLLLSMLCLHRAVLVTGVATPYALLSARLREAESLYRGIVDNSAEGLYQMALDGTSRSPNPALARMLGYETVEQLLFVPPHKHLPGGEAQFREILAMLKRTNPLCNYELEMLRRDGSSIWASMSLSLVFGGDQPHIHGSLRDISERVRAENLRSDVDRILQHELRSPLNGIVGLGALLRDDPNLTASQREMVDMVVDTGWGMLRMIDESLTLRRLEEGTYTPQLWSMDLADVLKRVAMWTKPLAQTQRVRVTMELAGRGELALGDDRCLLRSDGALLEHIFSNLLKNAVEASPHEGRVRIGVDCEEHSPLLRVEVSNLGVIPEAVRPRFFERYATSGKVKGTGLGTYVARLAVEALGGSISFRTSETEGTVLTVLLPKSEARASANSTLAAKSETSASHDQSPLSA